MFGAYAAALLLYPAYETSATPRVFAMCEVSAPLELWLQGAFHTPVAVYGLLTTVGAGMFLRPKILQAAALSLAVAIGVEAMEAVFHHGDCRVRDLLPATIGIAMAIGVHTMMRSATPKVVKVKKVETRRPRRPISRRKWISL